jgi:hypothetical protein
MRNLRYENQMPSSNAVSLRSSSFLPALSAALAAVGLISTAQAQLQVAGNLLINVDATTAPLGPLTAITNIGSMGGVFEARYGTNVPTVAIMNGNGTRGLQFDGTDFMQHYNSLGGALVPADPTLTGANPTCSIEAWVLNPGLSREETIVSWGHRGGGDGQNTSFNFGWDARWGAVGHWGAPDIGWDSCCDSDFNPPGNPQSGRWHHLVYSFDGTTQRLYSDGVLKNSENVTLNTYPNPPVTIAAQMTDDIAVEPGLRGTLTIGRLRIHSEALSSLQVSNNYSFERSAFSDGGALLPAGPTHRYNFGGAARAATNGAPVPDLVGTAHGAIRGTGANFTGNRVTLPGGASATAPYIDLPNGLLSVNSTNNGGSGGVTFEGWVKITGGQTWSRVLDFGSSDIGGGIGGEVLGPGGGGAGLDYLFLTAQDGGDVNRHVVDVRNVDPGPGTDPAGPGWDSGNFNRDYHFALTWNEATGQIIVYENGSPIASMSAAGTAMSDIHDVNCWLGRSNWNGDQNTQGEFDEFRIYPRVLPPEQISQNFVAGPDLVPTTNPVSFVSSPQSLTIAELQNAAFTVSLQGSPPVGLRWFTNGVVVPGASTNTFTLNSLLPTQSGLQVFAVASNFVGGTAYTRTSSVAILTILGDTNPPTVLLVRVRSSNQLEVIFSEPLRPNEATNAVNFGLTGTNAPTILGATLSADGTRVLLTLSGGLMSCESYVVSVNNVRDASVSANVIAPGTTISFWNYNLVSATHRYTFNNAPGNASGATVPDIVGGANGVVLNGGGVATFTGNRLTLSGGASASAPYVDLPNRLLSTNSTNSGGSGAVTLEGWVKVTGVQSWSRIFDFGSTYTNGTTMAGEVFGPGNAGEGRDYLFYSAMNGTTPGTRQIDFRNEDPAGGGAWNTAFGVANFNQDFHFAVTWDEASGAIRVYENGVFAAQTITTVGMNALNDVNVWLGRSNWGADGNMQGEFDEFRMYNRILSTNEIMLDRIGGPDNNFGALLGVDLALRTNSLVTNTVEAIRVLARFSNVGTQDLARSGCITYSSTASNIVYISADGVIHAGQAGTATVRASLGGFTDSEVIGVTQDATPPFLVSARANSSRQVEVVFSEPVDQGTSEEAGNYLVFGLSSTNEILSIVRLPNQSRVLITLSSPLAACEFITVQVSFVADQSPLFNQIAENSRVGFFNYVPSGLAHRYTFNNTVSGTASGSILPDTVGTVDGIVNGSGATFTGDRVTMPGGASGSAGWVQFPAGLLSTNAALNGGSGKLTFEGWARVTGARNWGRIFDFGSTIASEGRDYFMLSASIGTDVNNRRTELRNEDPAGGGITTVDHATTGFNRNQHFTVTWDEQTGQIRVYEDGALKSQMTVDDRMSDINDVNCYLGRSNWSGDETMQGEFDEFRIYNRVLATNEIALNETIGPDNNLGRPLALRISVTNLLQVGQTARPSVFADFSNISNVDLTLPQCFTLQSSNPSVISNDAAGVLHAVSAGTANIIARLNGLSNSAPVTVSGAGSAGQVRIQRTGTNYTITLQGTAGTINRTQRTTNLNPPIAWSDISTNTAPPGGVISVQDTNPPPNKAFYRVISP